MVSTAYHKCKMQDIDLYYPKYIMQLIYNAFINVLMQVFTCIESRFLTNF